MSVQIEYHGRWHGILVIHWENTSSKPPMVDSEQQAWQQFWIQLRVKEDSLLF